MRIAVDGEVLFVKEKTGIAWNATRIIENIKCDGKNEYQINYFDFLGLRKKPPLLEELKEKGWILNRCIWIPFPLNKLILQDQLHMPYKIFFGHKADYTLFFNFLVPPKVGTKSAVYICDVNYKVFPETMDKKILMWLENNMKKFCNRAEKIITISEFSKKEIIKYLNIDAKKIGVVPCGVDAEERRSYFDEVLDEECKEKYGIHGDYYLYLGTLEPRKNIPNLIRAYSLLKKEQEDIPKLVIAGKKGWQYNEIFDIVTKEELSDSVIFTGYVEQKYVFPLMKNAQAFAFVSLYEGFGMPPLEAMAFDVPVIVSDEASLPEVVNDAAMIVKCDDIEMIAKALKDILSPEIRNELIQKGRENVDRMSWDNTVNKLERYINS